MSAALAVSPVVWLALGELRDLARGIRPPALDLGLGEAVQTLAARNPIPVDVAVDLAVRRSIGVETMAYFCVAELLANVSRHSGASSAAVRIHGDAKELRILVEDNGSGGVQVGNGFGAHRLAGPAGDAGRPVGDRQPGGWPHGRHRCHSAKDRAVTRLVIAEDSAILREGLVQLLVERGHEVVAKVGTADELIDVANQFTP
jgi:hypothetical protein